jgi:hypothetical protein
MRRTANISWEMPMWTSFPGRGGETPPRPRPPHPVRGPTAAARGLRLWRPGPARAAPRALAGIAVADILVGILLLAVVATSISWVLTRAERAEAEEHARDPLTAALLAREIQELAMKLGTVPSGQPAATRASEVAGLDTLDGAAFCPPIDSDKQLVAGRRLWKQCVRVSRYDRFDLTRPVSEGFGSGQPQVTNLFKLSVDVWLGDTFMGTWWWWLNP